MKKVTARHRSRLAAYRNAGGTLTPAAIEITDDVEFMDDASNLAVDVAMLCEKARLHYTLSAVLKNPRATRAFMRNLRRCVGPGS